MGKRGEGRRDRKGWVLLSVLSSGSAWLFWEGREVSYGRLTALKEVYHCQRRERKGEEETKRSVGVVLRGCCCQSCFVVFRLTCLRKRSGLIMEGYCEFKRIYC